MTMSWSISRMARQCYDGIGSEFTRLQLNAVLTETRSKMMPVKSRLNVVRASVGALY
jgi:hypothetical protein